MSKLDTQVDDESITSEYEDVDSIVDEMIAHEDVRTIMFLKYRNLLTDEMVSKILDEILEDARAYIKTFKEE